MIFIDSWVWIEFFTVGEKHKQSYEVLQKIYNGSKALIDVTVLTEVKYSIAKKFGIEVAEAVIFDIENYPNLKIIPVISEVSKLACDLRLKYYKSKTREISFLDTTHLASALVSGCEILYTGDPDFNGIEKMKVVII